MDDVFAVALHRVILPQRIGGNFVIEVDEEESSGDGNDRGTAGGPRVIPGLVDD
jgi:hypothetical protein